MQHYEIAGLELMNERRLLPTIEEQHRKSPMNAQEREHRRLFFTVKMKRHDSNSCIAQDRTAVLPTTA
jgi:hypothetical protein